jgi:hypothetical protein
MAKRRKWLTENEKVKMAAAEKPNSAQQLSEKQKAYVGYLQPSSRRRKRHR